MVLRWACIALDGFKTAQNKSNLRLGLNESGQLHAELCGSSHTYEPQTKLSPYILSQKMKNSVIYRDHKLVTDGNVVRLEDVLCQRRGEGPCIVYILYIIHNT